MRNDRELTTLDWLLVLVGGLLVVFLFFFPFVALPTIAARIQPDGELLTELALSRWFPMLAGLIAGGLLASAFTGRFGRATAVQRVLVVSGFVVAAAASTVTLAGIYGPLAGMQAGQP